jgi:beta-lactamase regulating signal transducer with metallopeptidase domain
MTHTLQSLAWTLIHFCWQAAIVAVVYRVLSVALACRSSQARYVVALVSLLLMLASAGATFAWEMRSGASSHVFITKGSNPETTIAASDLPRTMAPGIVAASPMTESFSPVRLLPWIDGLWVIGVVALSLRSLGGWWLIQRLRASANDLPSAAIRANFKRISNAMGLRRIVLLRVSSAIAGPIAVGTIRTLVVLPLSAVTSLSPEELEVVMAHELAHICRADFFWNLLQTLAETLFFFHPAVWWISARTRHERELCCDDIALRICPNPIVYAHALYLLEKQRSRQLNLAMALDGHQSPQTLRMRIARILGEPLATGVSRPSRPFSLVAAFAALAILGLPVPQLLATLNPTPKASPAPVTASELSLGSIVVRPVIAVHIAANHSVSAAHPHIQAATPEPAPETAPEANTEAQSDDKTPGLAKPGSSYIDRMKAAGYDVDLDKLIAMKTMNVTPEYASAMANVGFGKPSADDLVACKSQGITPEFVAQIKKDGFEIKSLQDAIAYKMFGVTPEFAAAMKAAGFDGLTSSKLLDMRVQGITPEYVRDIRQQFPNATAEEVLQTRIFRIDAAFIASAQKHGFKDLSLQKLVQLRISGLLDDESNQSDQK